jgi:hypothetical protein
VIGDVEAWLLETFDWESPHRVNPKSTKDLNNMCTEPRVKNRSASEWRGALSRLTGQPGAKKGWHPYYEPDGVTRLTRDGKALGKNGRCWLMPPEIGNGLTTEDGSAVDVQAPGAFPPPKSVN